MTIGKTINKLRIQENLSQEQFAELFGVSRQSVQKWESDISVPELSKLIKIVKHFNISLDLLLLDRNERELEDKADCEVIQPNYGKDNYTENLETEYTQSSEEGLDIKEYENLFKTISSLPKGKIKKRFSDILFDIVCNAKTVKDYQYTEPSDIDEIKCLRKDSEELPAVNKDRLEEKISGAWMGRICGCLLGKTVEGIKTDELVSFLKETNNYPMHRYILHSDINDDILSRYKFGFARRCYADTSDGMPTDDDTNYVVLAQEVINKYGRDFTPYNVAESWVALQSINAYFTAEDIAIRNFIHGFEPPRSATYKNPFREWIGAQIRGDYFGYINPGNPELAADMAFRDASISHVKNGIYGEMFVSAMIAAAACTDDIKKIIAAGLAQIPYTSRLYESVVSVVSGFDNGVSFKTCIDIIHKLYDEYTSHGWCHVISNAMIVVAALLYGNGDYGKSVCMAVQSGFDTDCNGATVGSIIGMAKGINAIDESWTKPLNDTLHTSILGNEKVKISDKIKMTMTHIQ